MNFIRLRRFVFIRPVGGYNIKRHLKAIWVFFAMSVATTVYTNLDTVMLGFIKTDADVGYYNTAVKVKNILCSLVTSLGTVAEAMAVTSNFFMYRLKLYAALSPWRPM